MTLAAAGAFSLLLLTTVPSQDPDTARIDSFMMARMESGGVPGAAVAIVSDGRVVHMRGYGRADDSGRPVTPATPFTLGSLTKSFTALAVLQLVDDGRIELDAPVQRYLPWFRVADGAADRITVRHLLNQMSGLSTRTGNLTQADRDSSATALERRVRSLAEAELEAAPGEQFAYSNANYQMLGSLIEAVSGVSYEAYVRDRILDPLGMGDSHLSAGDALADGATPGYTLRFGRPVQAREIGLGRGSVAQGGMVSSARDLARYLAAVMGGTGDADGVVPEGVAPDSVRAILVRPAARIAPGRWYAAGWYVTERGDERTIWHGGDSPQGKAALMIAPDRDVGVAVLLNAGHSLMGQPMTGIVNGVFSLVLDADPPPAPGRGTAWVVFALLALVPVLVAASVFRTVRLLRRWRSPGAAPGPGWRSWALRVALPSLALLALAWLVLFALPAAYDAPLSAVRLFAPDVWWLMVIGGGSAVLWAAVRPVLVGRALLRGP